MLTPFDAQDNVDYALYRKHAESILDKGASGFCIGGSTGEFEALTFDEIMKIAELVVEVASARGAYVIAGMGGRSTKEAVLYAQNYEKRGVDMLLVLPPYYYGFGEDEVIQYYLDVAASVKLPIMVYNNPGKTHVKITPAMIAEMARKADNIRFTKDSSEDVRNVAEVIEQTNGQVTVFAGWDSIMLESLMMGATAVFSGGGGNCMTDELVKLYNLVAEKRFDEAKAQYAKIRPFLVLIEDHGRLATWIKCCMGMVHYDMGVARKPYAPIRPEEREQIKKCCEQVGLLK